MDESAEIENVTSIEDIVSRINSFENGFCFFLLNYY